MQTMRKFTIGRFTIRAEIEPETDLDLSWDDDGEVSTKLESGEYEAFCTKVSVHLNGVEIAADYLGESIYANPADFFTEHYGINATQYGAYFPGMAREAIAEARQWMRDANLAAAA